MATRKTTDLTADVSVVTPADEPTEESTTDGFGDSAHVQEAVAQLILFASSYERGALGVKPGPHDERRLLSKRIEKLADHVKEVIGKATSVRDSVLWAGSLTHEITKVYHGVRDGTVSPAEERARLASLFSLYTGRELEEHVLDWIALDSQAVVDKKGPKDAAGWCVTRIFEKSSPGAVRERRKRGENLPDSLGWQNSIQTSPYARIVLLEYVLVNLLGLTQDEFGAVMEAIATSRPDVIAPSLSPDQEQRKATGIRSRKFVQEPRVEIEPQSILGIEIDHHETLESYSQELIVVACEQILDFLFKVGREVSPLVTGPPVNR